MDLSYGTIEIEENWTKLANAYAPMPIEFIPATRTKYSTPGVKFDILNERTCRLFVPKGRRLAFVETDANNVTSDVALKSAVSDHWILKSVTLVFLSFVKICNRVQILCIQPAEH